MLLSTSSQECFEKRRRTVLKECVAAQKHFVDLFRLVRNSAPAECVSVAESFFADAIDRAVREPVEKRDR